MATFTFKGDNFYMDDKPYTVLSGAMHYFRIPREYWYDRLLKLKECGFNTVETYTCWNLHEPQENVFDFSGNLDIEAYIDTAAELGLNVILRPGPYICAEWEFGGFPAWLLTYKDIPLRCYNETFISLVARYYKELLGRVRPRLASNGGNVIMLQVENEYGSYGDDKEYLRAIAKIYRDNEIDCLYFTSDGPTYTMLSGGALDEYLCVANFGSKSKKNIEFLRNFRKDQPAMCGEYWCGWFDHWFEKHHVRDYNEIYDDFEDFLRINASVNFYMFHGGTNFGFMNGANYADKYQPTITSYDYSALLTESGDRTEAYYKIREIIGKYFGNVPEITAKDSEKAAYGKIKLTEKAELFTNLDCLSTPIKSTAPKFMEDVGQNYGYILYRSTLKGPWDAWDMRIEPVHDRAQIFVNGEHKGTYDRTIPLTSENSVKIPLGFNETANIDILVENMGRVNYGPKLRDRKGIENVRFGNTNHFGWEIYPLPMDDLTRLSFSPANAENELRGPIFLRGTLKITDAPKDTFLRLDGFTKGFVVVNGINIGRYYNPAGPQKTLYVPAPFLKQGENEIIVFESDLASAGEIEFLDKADLG